MIANHLATYQARPGFILDRHTGMFFTSLGGFGADIFFDLSGYIITMRLVLEQTHTHRIDLNAFYVRRAFLPPAIVYLAVYASWLSLRISLTSAGPISPALHPRLLSGGRRGYPALFSVSPHPLWKRGETDLQLIQRYSPTFHF